MALRYTPWPCLCQIASTAALVIMVALPAAAQSPATDAQYQLQSLDVLVEEAYRAGDYSKGIALAERALGLARQTFGDRDPKSLARLSNLVLLYQAQGRYSEAEPLSKQALEASREVLGPRHPQTLRSLNSLASLYRAQGRFGEAELFFKEALQISREVLGPRDPRTLILLDNLGDLYQAQGRYSEAEPLFKEALQTSREVLGTGHPDTLITLNNLAVLHESQGRYGEAEPLFREVLQRRREVLGPHHPETMESLNNLAGLYSSYSRFGEAGPLFKEALEASREVLGPRHPRTILYLSNLAAVSGDGEAESLLKEALQASREVLGPRAWVTLSSLDNLAHLYLTQGRYGEADPLLNEALQANREVLGPRHPNTLVSLNNLADLYQAQGRYSEAEPLSKQALEASREVLGPRHPQTLRIQVRRAVLLVGQGRWDEAVQMLQQMERHLLDWIGQELYSTEAGAVRRQLVSSQATFQDVVLTLATVASRGDVRRLAGSVMLHFKLLQGEEESYLSRLTRRSQDPRVQALAEEIGKLRAALAGAAQAQPGAFDNALQALEAKQLALGALSRDYKDHLRVLTANLDDLRAALPIGAVLIEFRQFQPRDSRTGRSQNHFAAVLLAGSDEPVVTDLGPVSEMPQPAGALDDTAAAALYHRLFSLFEPKLANATTVYVAPDEILNLVPFAQLKLADGRYWAERQEVRLLQSGRDLLRPDPDKPARGLLALGGIEFGTPIIDATKDGEKLPPAFSELSRAVTRAAGTFRNGFARLAASGEEALEIKKWYQRLRKDEPAEVWSGADASKSRLMAMTSPPRVLHLATHGFYLAGERREPMLQSGVALAGANSTLADNGTDGILFALEAQGLNLEGSELVVLSACDTAQGSLDYSEGVYGLARALRTAGARNVLVTLWPVNDGQARDFMVGFYKNWLSQVRSDPAKALRETQLSYLKSDPLRDPRVWAPYILIE